MNLKKIILQLKQNETIIIDLWIQSKVFEEVLSRYIVPEYFRDNYAHLIFQYFIDVVEDKTKIGDCPSMKSFLHYCSIEGFKIDDVYRICAHFRHALSLYLIKNNLMSEEIYQELNYILDENLSGVLSIYNGMVDTKNTTISNQQQWITQYERVIDKILIVSKADIHGRILYANDNFLNISGYTRSELIGASHNIVRHPDMPKAVFKNVWKTLLSKKPWSGVIENMTKSGTSYYVSTIIIPILDVNGEIIEFLSSRTDLTELFTLKHEKERSEELLMKQSASAEMGDMISLISHQWKQPLASISSIVNNIIVQKELNIEPTDTGIEEFQEINKLVQYLSETIDDFRVFFKPDKVKKEINVFQTVQSTLTLMQARLKALDIKVSVDEEDAFNISLYENDLKQVLLNIYNNTADMVEEKKIQNARLDISFEQDNNIGKIIIEDNGSGIDETLLPSKLFEIYETTKGDKGTGIGLQLCKIIVENKFHGKIYAQNKNDGASFTIELALS